MALASAPTASDRDKLVELLEDDTAGNVITRFRNAVVILGEAGNEATLRSALNAIAAFEQVGRNLDAITDFNELVEVVFDEFVQRYADRIMAGVSATPAQAAYAGIWVDGDWVSGTPRQIVWTGFGTAATWSRAPESTATGVLGRVSNYLLAQFDAVSINNATYRQAVNMVLRVVFPVPVDGGGGAGGGAGVPGPATQVPDTYPPLEEIPEVVAVATAAPAAAVTASQTAVAALVAEQENLATGIVITMVGNPIVVAVAADVVSLVSITLPAGHNINTRAITTMAMLVDGELVPVPTRIDRNGNITVLVSGNVTLVPLNVEADFIDIDFGPQFGHVADEILRAASMLIVMGRGDGVFDPTAQVTTQEAVTMFLRASGVPVTFTQAVSIAQNLNLIGTVGDQRTPMTRIQTATLISNSLSYLGMEVTMTVAQARTRLAGFTDIGNLSNDQLIALAICVDLDIFRGAGGGVMNPNAVLQRRHTLKHAGD
jgi:hypothetical protein